MNVAVKDQHDRATEVVGELPRLAVLIHQFSWRRCGSNDQTTSRGAGHQTRNVSSSANDTMSISAASSGLFM